MVWCVVESAVACVVFSIKFEDHGSRIVFVVGRRRRVKLYGNYTKRALNKNRVKDPCKVAGSVGGVSRASMGWFCVAGLRWLKQSGRTMMICRLGSSHHHRITAR